MNFVEYGRGRPQTLLFLHGGGLSWWNYRAQAELLQDRFHVVLPILDGHAGSDRNFTTIADNARGVLAYIDAHLGGRVLLIGGLSLGAQVLVELLAQRPDVCRYAVIESALTRPMRLTRALIRPALGMSYGLIRRPWFARLQFASLHMPPELFDDYYRDTCRITRQNMIAFLAANQGFSCSPAVSASRARALILAGSREPAAIRASAAGLRRLLPGSTLQILRGYRHGQLSLNHPEQYAALVEQLLSAPPG